MGIKEKIKNVIFALKFNECLEEVIEKKHVFELLFNEMRITRKEEISALEDLVDLIDSPSKFIYTPKKDLKNFCSSFFHGDKLYKILVFIQEGIAKQEYDLRKNFERIYNKKLNELNKNSLVFRTIDKKIKNDAIFFRKKYLNEGASIESIELKLLAFPFILIRNKVKSIGFIDTSYVINNYTDLERMQLPLKENDVSVGIHEVYEELIGLKSTSRESENYKRKLTFALWNSTNVLTPLLRLEKSFINKLKYRFGETGQKADCTFAFYKDMFSNKGIKTRIYTDDFRLERYFE